MRIRTLERQQTIPAPLKEVFAFFSEARNLNVITPSWLRFELVGQSEEELKAGTLIHYNLAWHGLPVRWTSLIEQWHPPQLFTDVQVKGPYRLWRHTHTFAERGGATLIADTVQYAVPMGFLGDFCAGWMVRRDVEKIFDYRRNQLSSIF